MPIDDTIYLFIYLFIYVLYLHIIEEYCHYIIINQIRKF